MQIRIQSFFQLEEILGNFSGGLARVWMDPGVGFVDRTGTLVIEARYGEASDFIDGVAAATERGGLRGGGRLVTTGKTEDGDDEGIVERPYYVIDRTGARQFDVDRKYSMATPLTAQTLGVTETTWYHDEDPHTGDTKATFISKNYIIDRSSKVLAGPQPRLDSMIRQPYHLRSTLLRSYTPAGEPLRVPDLESGWVTDGFSIEGLAPYAELGDWLKTSSGFVDSKGNIVVPAIYQEAGRFVEGLAPVRTGDAWGYLDMAGEMAIEPRFEEARPFSEGVAAVSVEQRWAYVGGDGEFVIPPSFDLASGFSEGLAAVLVDGELGYIEPSGDWAFKLPWTSLA